MMASSKPTFWICCAAALVLIVALADAQTFFQNGRYGKRSSDLRFRGSRSGEARFFGGPRFGRSGAILPGTNELERNAERFFIGSRYGKRSGVEQAAAVASADVELATLGNSDDKDIVLECVPVGVGQFYTCERKNTKSPEEK